MNMFTKFFRKLSPREKTIFIVEDNEVYAKSLEGFLTTRFPGVKTKIFPVGEACLQELYQNPTVIIMDHLLNANYKDAATGLSIIKKIKAASSGTKIILLSAQTEFDVIAKAILKYRCTYLQKDEQAFNKVEQFIKEVFKHKKNFAFVPWNR